jgi:chemotaxis methyl-accepting protein methylase
MRSFRQFPSGFLRFFEDFGSVPRDMAAQNQAVRYRRVRDSIRRLVRIERANLMDRSPPCRIVDLLLCRNVFIYIEQGKQGSIQSMLASSMRRGGVMVLSPVDTLHCKSLFRECWYDRCLVYEKQ